MAKSFTEQIWSISKKIKNDRFQICENAENASGVLIMDTDTGKIAQVSVFEFGAVAKVLNKFFPKPKKNKK